MSGERVETAEQLDALPHLALLRTHDGDLWERRGNHGRWDNLSTDGSGGLQHSLQVPLPAVVLYRPEKPPFDVSAYRQRLEAIRDDAAADAKRARRDSDGEANVFHRGEIAGLSQALSLLDTQENP